MFHVLDLVTGCTKACPGCDRAVTYHDDVTRRTSRRTVYKSGSRLAFCLLFLSSTINMASLLASATDAAHSAAVSLMSAAEVKPGSTIPISVPVKEEEATKTFTFEGITGKNIFIGVPGAFTGTCSAQVPAYIGAYDKFKAKGINNIYVVAVNDVFTMKAWKEKLASEGTPVHFVADDKGAFVGALGMLFDASELLGAPRSKRFVLITDGDKVTHVAVEPVPSGLTITAAEKILPLL